MLAVNKNGYYGLSLASDRLRDDKEVVIEAVKKDGNAIKYASKRLKNDREVVLTAIKNTYSFVPIDYLPIGIDYMSKELKEDPEIKKVISIRHKEVKTIENLCKKRK